MKIYNSYSRKIEELIPIENGKIGIYVCGPTVQSSPHIGHLRSSVAFDVIRRYLMAIGYNVSLVQNVTDIDDKIIAKSKIEGLDWKEHAKKYEEEFWDKNQMLNILPPTSTPHATKYIPAQIAMIAKLIDNGYAYTGSVGNVWFDTTAWKDYGELTRQQNSDDLEASDEDLNNEKRNPRDFALWKAPKTGDPQDASWESPWGRGRPGWHIECSAMSTDLLGSKFDIHGGGIDLRFPHHENEIAQARAAGNDFAAYWLHSSWVTAKGEKMSKSLGNGLGVMEVTRGEILRAMALRYALASVHYRTQIEWEDATLDSCLKTIERIYKHIKTNGGKYTDDLVENVDIKAFPEFVNAMNDDFNVSGAFAAIHSGIKEGVSPLILRRALNILGVDPFDIHWRSSVESAFEQPQNSSSDFNDSELTRIKSLIDERIKAKKAKDFAIADAIRDQLALDGIELIDTAEGTEFLRKNS